MKPYRHLRWLLPSLIVVAAGSSLWLYLRSKVGSDPIGAETLSQQPATVRIARGRYLAAAADCIACHTASKDRPAFAGGLPMATPVGTIYSTNITPDPDTGIGRYSYQDFERAVRRGVRRDGSSLYPAMPFPSYARLSRGDVQALYSYFMQAVPAQHQPNHPTDIVWPLSMRWPLRLWRYLFSPLPTDQSAPSATPILARGRYLVESAGHCGACHTPRGLAMQERALSEDPSGHFLAGGHVEGWDAPSLRNDQNGGLGNISETELSQFLLSGRSEHLAAFAGMAEVVSHSTQHLSPADAQAIAHYLKSLPARTDTTTTATSSPDSTRAALHQLKPQQAGAREYIDNCMACHRADGNGYAYVFPSLAGNPVLQQGSADSIIHLLLLGGTSQATQHSPDRYRMPGFADRLDDAAIARVASFITHAWGNHGPDIAAKQVRAIRQRLKLAEPIATTD